MKRPTEKSLDLYVLTALSKGFPVFCSVLLPVLYAGGLIAVEAIGYIGAIFIGSTITGAVVVAKWLHVFDSRRVLQVAALGTIAASSLIFVSMTVESMGLLIVAYGVMGVMAGVALSGVNAITANRTTRGDRFKMIARLSMVADMVRVGFSMIIAGLVVVGQTKNAALLITFAAVIFLFYVSRQKPVKTRVTAPSISTKAIKHNRMFKFVLSLEFLDSFSSSQLFVFLPLLFLAKGYSLENSILLQAFTFVGYMSGRWLVSALAQKLSGLKAVSMAEMGLVISILLLLVAQPLWALYVLTFALGIFARGTSPAIKSLAFDSLDDNQVKQGSALHVIVGDSGSAVGQLVFGLLAAFYGARSPFIAASCIAAMIALLCLPRVVRLFRLVTNANVSPNTHLLNRYS